MPALVRLSNTVVMPKAHKPNGAGLAMPSFAGTGVVGIMILKGFFIGFQCNLSVLSTSTKFFKKR
jgi:hypothetical protein